MNAAEKRSLVEYLGSKYRRANKRYKGELIKEGVVRLNLGERQVRRLFSTKDVGRPRNPYSRGRPSKYGDPEFRQALRRFWKVTRYMCSRHLKSAIPDWLPMVEDTYGKFPDKIKMKLLSISAPTIDRILKPYKAIKGKSLTRSGGFRDEIPIQENIWNIEIPGFLEADTAAHCGGSTMGEYISSLMMVDIATTWTEARAVFGKGSHAIVHAIEDIENQLPFDILGYDTDNGTEVLNKHVLRYFRDERLERNKKPVQVTRSRAYKKNDNAHVEQRNYSVARRWLGYERLGFKELQPLVNHYYADIVCPLMNHFYPSFKLADKIRIKSRTRRVYKDPITPYARVMSSSHVSDDKKSALLVKHQALNPITLLKQEALVRKQIDSTLRWLKAGLAIKHLDD